MNPDDPILPPEEADADRAAELETDDDETLDAHAPAPAPAVEAAPGGVGTPDAPPFDIETAADADADADAEDDETLDETGPVLVPVAEAVTGAVPREPAPAPPRKLPAARPDLIDRREPLYRECRGYTLRLDPPDLARLRELAGSRGKSDDELGEAFFDGQAERLAASIADDVPSPSEIRVVVDPYSRQAFLALANRIRGILSF